MEDNNNNDKIGLKVKVHGLVQQFLGGPWSKASPEDLILDRIHGGMVNNIFHCGIKDVSTDNDVLVRFYSDIGDMVKDFFSMDIAQEVMMSYIIGQNKLGPKIHGVFTGGRIEQFIESKTLQNSDTSSPILNDKIARHLARFHSLDVPITKNSSPFVRFVEGVYTIATDEIAENPARAARFTMNFEKEWKWLKSKLLSCTSPVVFSHSDMNQKNILVKTNGEVIFCDYDLTSYGFRGYDLGYYFNMRNVDTHNKDLISSTPNPTEDEQRHFIASYLDEWQKIHGELEPNENVDRLMIEAKFFGMVGYFWFTCWFASERATDSKAFQGLDIDKIYKNFSEKYQNEKETFLALPNWRSIFKL